MKSEIKSTDKSEMIDRRLTGRLIKAYGGDFIDPGFSTMWKNMK